MPTHYNTNDVPPEQRSRRWHDVIGSTYFPLNLRFRRPQTFNGALAVWRLGNVSLSRLQSDALTYERLPQHLSTEHAEQYLVTVPVASDVCFSQCQVDLRCKPGAFIFERGHEPYVFGHEEANDLWVLKVPGEALRSRIRAPGRFSTLQFDAKQGVGALFSDMLRLIPSHFVNMSTEAHGALGQQLVDLLVLALKSDERALFSQASAVREAHLSRIEQFVRTHLAEHELSPERAASACTISVRYLHELFRDTNQTFGAWVREQRLSAAKLAIEDRANNQTIAEIAYRWGFSDQAQFSRLFRAAFGATASDYRQQSRARL
jgi:AraC-like DNA-binding protein